MQRLIAWLALGLAAGASAADAHGEDQPQFHDVHFHLVLVAVMPEAEVGVVPRRLRRELLDDEGFQQVAQHCPVPGQVLCDSTVFFRQPKPSFSSWSPRK